MDRHHHARGVLYSGNMACDRDSLLAEGAFDERRSLRFAAEDNDLCHRWARAQRPLRYEPQLIVTHHDWRSDAEMAAVHARYARGQGAFYAKHLLRGDRAIMRFVLSDLWRGIRPSVARMLRRETSARASAFVLPAMLVGLADGAWDCAGHVAFAGASARGDSSQRIRPDCVNITKGRTARFLTLQSAK